MTTIYVPRLIESAEQAEELPIGTVATFAAPGLITAAVKNAGPLPGWWCGDARVPVGAKPGWTALVPVEVEVEQIRESGDRRRTKTLYVTPWEES